jgi:hypothetical protein
MLTKETMIHIAVGIAITGAVFAVMMSSGSMQFTEMQIKVNAKASLQNNLLFLSYTIQNTGDYDMYRITIKMPCCNYHLELQNPDGMPVLKIANLKNDLSVIPVIGLSVGDEIVIQVDAYDKYGHHGADVIVVDIK